MTNGVDLSDAAEKKLALVQIARRCFERGLQTNSGGNLSVRLACGDRIVIKPSGVGYNECTPENLMICDLRRNVVAGEGRPSKDLDFHAGIYEARPDVEAIVHVHSPWATGWACAGREIPCLTVQTMDKLKRIPLIPLSANSGPQGAAEVVPVLRDKEVKAAILQSHGTIGVGRTLIAAQYIVELIEETAHVAYVREILNAANSSNQRT